MKFIVAALACVLSPIALAAPPAAPVLTVQATDIRQLDFTYEPVPGVARYELWFRAAPGAAWVKYAEREARRAPVFRIGVAVHLLDWEQARYYVKACNPSGCTASNQVGVNGEKLTAIGFFKPNAPTGHFQFGNNVALSADGKTLAVLTGENLGGLTNSVVVHVYRKTTATSGWRREARLLPNPAQTGTSVGFSGDPLALSADGNLLVLGNWRESLPGHHAPAGVGAVYLFRRSGSAWALSQKIMGENQPGDSFGHSVKIDDAGQMLVVSHFQPGGRFERGTLEIFRDLDAGDQFEHTASLPVPITAGQAEICDIGLALSGDGQTMLRACRLSQRFVQVLSGPGFTETTRLMTGDTYAVDISGDGKVALIQNELNTYAYRLGSDGWAYDGDLSQWGYSPWPGSSASARRKVNISRDGRFAAIGNPHDNASGLGPLFPPYGTVGEENRSGTVTVFERKSSGWVVRRRIKPGSMNPQWFGTTVALGDNGRVLAVGAPLDSSGATGIDGDRDDHSIPQRGAVWLY